MNWKRLLQVTFAAVFFGGVLILLGFLWGAFSPTGELRVSSPVHENKQNDIKENEKNRIVHRLNVGEWPPALPIDSPKSIDGSLPKDSGRTGSSERSKFEKLFFESTNDAAFIQTILGDPTGAGLAFAEIAQSQCNLLKGIQAELSKENLAKLGAVSNQVITALESYERRCAALNERAGNNDFNVEMQLATAGKRTRDELHRFLNAPVQQIDTYAQIESILNGVFKLDSPLATYHFLDVYGGALYQLGNPGQTLLDGELETVETAARVFGCELYEKLCNQNLPAISRCLSGASCPSLNYRDHLIDSVPVNHRPLFLQALDQFRKKISRS
jgi:hypothetical protein